ncbi:hypothetical protein F0562_008661 [Nyssa sinensis]|uniref:Enhancer of mRNA-decapping protein 4 WD40 repeat region domain-containing protein n=1 Tax=Nyssa sinensis TaxID=561372 RepID=A0A5J5A9B9_9ASTE|nr:hypothetical protein F0562_008661 [Nyssa sinensis]
MAFFAEDVHLLASASIDGRVYIWKITEGPDEEDKPQITGKIVIAIQIVGEGESVHPRVCWHCHKQEVLVVGIGKQVLRIDTTKVGKGEVYSAEEPLKCHVDKLINGVQFVGKHDEEVTDLSMCQWMTTRLVSASKDGMIKIWDDRKLLPLTVLRPYDGQPVNSVTFLTAPNRPDHIILITAGPQNREVKIWALASEEGWLLPSDAESWQCVQTLYLNSSAETRVEEAFFNQVVALSQAGILLLANSKRNAIYAVHLEYGPNPVATRMDYIAEFTVTMPILSFTGTSDLLPRGERIVQVYCVQTQAIQQYALDLSQCLPPPLENVRLNHPIQESSSESAHMVRPSVSSASTESATSLEFTSLSMESKTVSLPKATSDNDMAGVAPPPLPLSRMLSRKLSGFRSPTNSFERGPLLNDRVGDQQVIEYLVDRQMDTVHTNLSDVPSLDDDSKNDENKDPHDDISTVFNHPIMFKHPTRLVTPSEILMAASSSEPPHVIEHKSEGEPYIQDVVVNSDVRNVEVDVKVVGGTGFSQNNELGAKGESHNLISERKEKSFCSQASYLGIEMAILSTSPNTQHKQDQHKFMAVRENPALSADMYIAEESQQLNAASVNEALPQSSSAEKEVHGSTEDNLVKVVDSATPAVVPQSPAPTTKAKKQKGKNTQGLGAFYQILAMQEMLNQLTTMQKEMQKQMTAMVAVPVTKEGRRLEAALGRSMEKAVKANADALWAHFQEDNTKQKLEQDCTQQTTGLITNCMNKDLPTMLEKTVKKELAAVGLGVARTVTPAVEKTASTAIAEAFQRGVGDKTVNQLEKSVNSKLEAAVARQIQSQFQTSGKQALQDALKSSLEASLSSNLSPLHSPSVLALRDAINSVSSMTQTLNGELVDGQRKLLSLAVAGANSAAVNTLVTQLSNGPLGGLHEKIEAPLDPTKELSRLVSEHKYEEAFTAGLQRSDVSIVSWLCSQVDLQGILSMIPLPLSQGVLLSLLQQLACDISKDTPRKLTWMTDIAIAINPTDPMISVHVRPIFEQVYQILNHHRSVPTIQRCRDFKYSPCHACHQLYADDL